MLYSFEGAVHEEVRKQLETNMAHVCTGENPAIACSFGQCIHHFVDSCGGNQPECVCLTTAAEVRDCFVYSAISGAVQTGPNMFTTLSALRYAGASGNLSWLSQWMSTLRSMMGFLEASFNPSVGLYLAPGSLQIDVFIRANYTADSNAMAVLLCELFADAEAALQNITGRDFYLSRASALREGLNKHLLHPSGDHYCTQSDPRAGGGVSFCTRDFVDYDANLLAVAARAPASQAVAEAILARVDSGKCTHTGRATWVSEIEYNASNCVNGNVGDSAISMGRIAWQDALARQAVGTPQAAQVFDSQILGPLQRDLLARTWLPERFDCTGKDAHNAYYFEYPSVVAMLVFEVKYGIAIRMTEVVVNPIEPGESFHLVLGSFDIFRNQTAFRLSAGQLSGARTFSLARVQPGQWAVSGVGAVTVGADGLLQWSGPASAAEAHLVS
jgi:hypothetical protein